MAKYEVGDQVQFKRDSALGHGQKRIGQIGTVSALIKLNPGEVRVDIDFPDGGAERGTQIGQIEHA